jgi:hypothetical protein
VEFQKAVFGGALTANVQSHVQLMSRTGKVTDSCYPKSCGPIGAGQLWSERIKDPASPWQESVVVRFYFLPGTDDARKDVYRKAAAAIYKATCIKVTEFANLDAVKDTKGYIGVGLQAGGEGTCYANMGEFKGSKINLGFCNSERNLGSVIHENLHAVGVNHEQKRPDGAAKDPLTGKGPHLTVDWDKMDPRWKSQWVGAPNSYVGSNDQGVGDVHSGYAKYDFDSLMHYPVYGGGKWDVKTIPAGMPTGQRSKIAESDSEQVNDMYQCLKNGDATRPPVETCFDTAGATGITLGGKPATCADLTRYCNHADYIKKACPKTCGVCTPGAPASTPAPVTPSTPAPVTPSTPAPVTPSTSAPVTPSTSAPVTPSTKAPVTPSTGAPVTESCTDKRPGSCPSWAKSGYCTEKYVDYMARNCPKSCGKCGGGPTPTAQPRPAPTASPTKCEDQSNTGFALNGNGISSVAASCNHMAVFCNHGSIGQTVRQRCPATCGACGGSGGSGSGGSGSGGSGSGGSGSGGSGSGGSGS